MDIIIENVRSFVNRHTIPVKPLTLLTGENSSGKSTLLASFAAVNDPFGFPFRPRLNDPPYSLGNYDTIATYKGGKYGRAKSFSLGYRLSPRTEREATELVATYISNEGLIELSSIAAKNNEVTGNIVFISKNGKPYVEISSVRDGKSYGPISRPFSEGVSSLPRVDLEEFFYFFLYSLGRKDREKNSSDEQVLEDIRYLFRRVVRERVQSIAPIRTKPRRTYDEISEEFSPEGEHVPFVLDNLLKDSNSREAIERFGVQSGLFTKLNVKRLGSHLSDPTQVLVTGSSRTANLIDVGYGVSQVLPVIVQSIIATRQNILLLQQPEVHLHPRAQAALGSLFVELVVKGKKQFIIETHSDYIIDRIRMEVGKGKMSANDVSILYLEKPKIETKWYSISLSQTGDICDPPPSYRAFFLQEEINLFNRAER